MFSNVFNKYSKVCATVIAILRSYIELLKYFSREQYK